MSSTTFLLFVLIAYWAHLWLLQLTYFINYLLTYSETPDLWLLSQQQSITALWALVLNLLNYTVWWQWHMCVNNLSRVVTWCRSGRELNLWPCYLKYSTITMEPSGRLAARSLCQYFCWCCYIAVYWYWCTRCFIKKDPLFFLS